MKIYIDQGHGYSVDTGALGNGLREQDITYQIGKKVGTRLSNEAINVKYSRNNITDNVGTSVSSSISYRYTSANTWGADYFISFHCNAHTSSSSNGVETLIYSTASKSADLAKKINDSLVKLGFTDRGVKTRPDLGVLRGASMPAMLLEIGFITNKSDSNKLKNEQDKIADAIANTILDHFGITKKSNEGGSQVQIYPKTVMTFNNVHMQIIYPNDFRIKRVNEIKTKITGEKNYVNLGYFANNADGSTLPVGNLVVDGEIITQTKDQPNWLNTFGKKVSTFVLYGDGKSDIVQTDSFYGNNIKYAVSGIPIIRNGLKVTLDEIKSEGWFGSELYDTWHGFLGIRYGAPIYVAAKCGFDMMVYILEYLGIEDGIKLDGGGSFIIMNGNQIIEATQGNRRINNILCW